MKYLVRLTNATNRDMLSELVSLGFEISYESKLMNLLVINSLDNANFRRLKKLNFIKEVEKDYYGELESNTKLNIVPKISFSIIHNNFKYGDTKVAVIDSGIDHMRNLNVISDTNFTAAAVNNKKHGTLVANIINQVVPGIQLLNIKVTDDGTICASDAMKAMELAYNEGANIINMSMGFCRRDDNGKPIRCKGDCNICRLVEILATKNILVIVAGGNEGPRIGSIRCPGNSPFAITVGALSCNNNIENYSSRGRMRQEKPDLVTAGTVFVKKGRQESQYTGTSFSAPIISGMCAGIFEKYKSINVIKDMILESTESLGCKYYEQGKGKFDILKLKGCIEYEKNISGAF